MWSVLQADECVIRTPRYGLKKLRDIGRRESRAINSRNRAFSAPFIDRVLETGKAITEDSDGPGGLEINQEGVESRTEDSGVEGGGFEVGKSREGAEDESRWNHDR
jgi:hypothetical protein